MKFCILQTAKRHLAVWGRSRVPVHRLGAGAGADCAVCSGRGQPVAICHPQVTGLRLLKQPGAVNRGVECGPLVPLPSLIPCSGNLCNSSCKPGWNKELSPAGPVPALPKPSRALCFGPAGFRHFWERAGDGEWKSVPSAEFWGCFAFLGIPSPELPGQSQSWDTKRS